MKIILLFLLLISPIEKVISAENSTSIIAHAIIDQYNSNINIVYNILNTKKTEIIINKYCAVKITAVVDDHIYEFENNGSDAFTKIKSTDIIILKPHEQTSLQISLSVIHINGFAKLLRSDESGTYWVTKAIKPTSHIELQSQYKNTLDKPSINKILSGINLYKYQIPYDITLPKLIFTID